MRPQDLASPEGAKRIVEEYLPVLRRTGYLRGVPIDLVTSQQRTRRLSRERDRGAQRGGRLSAHERRLHGSRRAGASRAALPRAVSRDAGNVAHGRQARPHHERQRSVARESRLSPRGSARPRDHRVHGQGDASHARRRPVGGRHRDGRARGRAAHVRRRNQERSSRSRSRRPAIATRAAPSSRCWSLRRTSPRAIERSASCVRRSRRTRGCAASSSASATTCARKSRSR